MRHFVIVLELESRQRRREPENKFPYNAILSFHVGANGHGRREYSNHLDGLMVEKP